jgi:hypothetical protein
VAMLCFVIGIAFSESAMLYFCRIALSENRAPLFGAMLE